MQKARYLIFRSNKNNQFSTDKETIIDHDSLESVWKIWDEHVKENKAISIWELKDSSGGYEMVREFLPPREKTFFEEQREEAQKEIITILEFFAKQGKDVKVPALKNGAHTVKALAEHCLKKLKNEPSTNPNLDYGKESSK